MHYAVVFTLLLVFVFGLGLLARRISVPYPILFVLGGLVIGFIPHLPQLRLDPNFVFFIFLPPLLYIQAFNTSWRDFSREYGPILLLAIGLVIVTTITVAYAAYLVIPAFPLAAGFVLGAIISPPDAIAASAIAQRLGLPRRIVTILEGESLVNDATSLVIFKIALVAAITPGLSLFGGVWWPGQALYIAGGGVAVGLAVGWVINWIRARLIGDGVQIILTISLLTPFVSYLAGEVTNVSSVLAVVTTGLYLGRSSPEVITPTIRLQAQAFWEIIIYILNGMVFVLIGLQLPGILHGMNEHWWPRPFLYAVLINVVCIGVRLFWVFPGAYLPRLLIKAIRRREPKPDWRQVFIIGWSGMRGVVSLAAALALNGLPDFPRGHLVQFLSFSVILVSLVFQGLTLPTLIRTLGIADDGSAAQEEIEARHQISRAVLEKIDEIRREEKFPASAIDRVEQIYRDRDLSLQDELADQLGWSDSRHHLLSLRRLHRSMVATERRTLLVLRRDEIIGDDVLHKIEHELDLEEARLKF
ncbi:MAG: Na+/H+ antiporter [Methylacidiphilales bacterium]|nr:Na+/H+ antiporter [Candidatus Methylacidiphilales bacterium]